MSVILKWRDIIVEITPTPSMITIRYNIVTCKCYIATFIPVFLVFFFENSYNCLVNYTRILVYTRQNKQLAA